jgi:hypothetical protein
MMRMVMHRISQSNFAHSKYEEGRLSGFKEVDEEEAKTPNPTLISVHSEIEDR